MERLLKQLSPEVASRIADQSLRAGAKVIVDAAKANAPKRTGQFADIIVARIERRPREEDQRVITIGFEQPHSRRAHLLEFGTQFAKATPFMRPALDANHQTALEAMGKVMARGITREAKKLAKGAKR